MVFVGMLVAVGVLVYVGTVAVGLGAVVAVAVAVEPGVGVVRATTPMRPQLYVAPSFSVQVQKIE